MLFRKKDFWAGAAFLSLGVALVFILIPFGVDEPRRVQFAALSPSYYPRFVAIAMALIGLVVVARAALANSDGGDLDRVPAGGALKVCAVLLILFATAYLLPLLGFVLASALALVVMMLIAGERNALTIGLVAVLLPLALYLFFTKLAKIPIPGGLIDPILLRI